MNRATRLLVLAAVLAAASFAGLLVGEVAISPADAWQAVLSKLGISGQTSLDEAVLFSIRLPRVVAGVLVGVALGVAGVGLQGVYRNHLADPYLLGVSAAAGLGVALGVTLAGAAAIVGTAAAVALGVLMAIATRRISASTRDPARFVLVGFALGLALLAWTTIIVFIADTPRLPTFTYFVFGSLGPVTWASVWRAIGFVAAGVAVVAAAARALDVMTLGDREASHLGVPVARVVGTVLVAVGLATGAAVSLGGVIGFVGLLGPLAARRLVGSTHRWLLPASALLGAIFVVTADVTARSIAGPVEVPIGIVTAAVGGPALVWMIMRRSEVAP